jgi:hypothetical protein
MPYYSITCVPANIKKSKKRVIYHTYKDCTVGVNIEIVNVKTGMPPHPRLCKRCAWLVTHKRGIPGIPSRRIKQLRKTAK